MYENENKPRFYQNSFFSYKHKLTNKKRIKNELRNTIGQEGLNHLTLMNININK